MSFVIWCVTIKYLYTMTCNSAKTADYSANKNKYKEKDNRVLRDIFGKFLYGSGPSQFSLIVSPARSLEFRLVCF
jgi:hypothetical protein